MRGCQYAPRFSVATERLRAAKCSGKMMGSARIVLCLPTSPENRAVAEKKTRVPNLEKSIAALEAVVEELEEGDLPLDKALQQFETGVKLSRECQQALEAAEQRVKLLVDDNLQDFAAEEDT